MMELLSEFPKFSSRISLVSVCPNKDLIAIVFSGILVVYRANGSIVSQFKGKQEKIMQCNFEPNGKFICCVLNDKIMILHVETCSVVFEHKAIVSHINWNHSKKIKSLDQLDKILPSLIPLRKLSFNILQHMSNDGMNIMICADGNNWELRVNGLWELGSFQLFTTRHDPECKIQDSCMTAQFLKSCFLSCKDDAFSLWFYDTSFLEENSDNIAQISHIVMQVNSYLMYLNESLSNLENEYSTFSNLQESKFAKIKEILNEHSINSSLKDEFLSFATFGSSKSVIAEFLLHSIDDAGLEKWGKSVNVSLTSMKKIIQSQIIPIYHRLLLGYQSILGYIEYYEIKNGFKLKDNSSLQILLHIVHHVSKFDVLISKGLAGSAEFMAWMTNEKLRLTDSSSHHGPSCSPTKILYSFIQDFISTNAFTDFLDDRDLDISYKPNSLMDIEFFDFPDSIFSLKTLKNRLSNETLMLFSNFGQSFGRSINLLEVIDLPFEIKHREFRLSMVEDSLNQKILWLITPQPNTDPVDFVYLIKNEPVIGWSFIQVPAETFLPQSCTIIDYDFYTCEYILVLAKDIALDSVYIVQVAISDFGWHEDLQNFNDVQQGRILHSFDLDKIPDSFKVNNNTQTVVVSSSRDISILCSDAI